jgi:pimeloyl-ACP methyl ester carboxylesterase
MSTVHINGVPYAYDEAGQGSPLLLIHAGIADRRMWDDVWPAFTAHHRVVRLDLRGFGDTPLPAGPFVYADDAAGLLRALGIDQAGVIGVSMGGHVAIDMAIGYREMVGRLVVVAAGIDGWEYSDAIKAEWDLEEAAWESGDLDEVAWVNVRTWLDGPTRGPGALPAGLRRRVWEMQRTALDHDNDEARGGWATESRRKRLGEITAPTLVMVGELDQPDFGEIARMLGSEIPGARFEELPGVAHLPPMEAPAEFSRVVLDFLAEP